MTADTIFIAFPRQLYLDIVRFSDGRYSPETIIANQVEDWISLSCDSDHHWGERTPEVAQIYAPDLYAQMIEDDSSQPVWTESRALLWKAVTVPAGSEVRMSYKAEDHFAKVVGGKIVDADGAFTPSAWASKVASNTSRDAWRDIWFREPGSKSWVSAQEMREKALGQRK